MASEASVDKPSVPPPAPPPVGPSPPVPPPADPEYVYHPKTHRKLKRGTPKYNELRDAFGFACLQQWHQEYVESKIWGKPTPPIRVPARPNSTQRSASKEVDPDESDSDTSSSESESSSSSEEDNRVELDEMEDGEIKEDDTCEAEEKLDPHPPPLARRYDEAYRPVQSPLPPIHPGLPHRDQYENVYRTSEPSYYYRRAPQQLPPQYRPAAAHHQPARGKYDFRVLFS